MRQLLSRTQEGAVKGELKWGMHSSGNNTHSNATAGQYKDECREVAERLSMLWAYAAHMEIQHAVHKPQRSLLQSFAKMDNSGRDQSARFSDSGTFTKRLQGA